MLCESKFQEEKLNKIQEAFKVFKTMKAESVQKIQEIRTQYKIPHYIRLKLK